MTFLLANLNLPVRIASSCKFDENSADRPRSPRLALTWRKSCEIEARGTRFAGNRIRALLRLP
ncbi:hypothetical protein Ga0080574_TMP2164 [Salipiger abyssi]|uniref:Uncharacterized protein n=1 Tax=Salipiger abyssi TaxID=1250539 RepID=A0A1P8UT22_9RHOB|nr:hypothetical protein Ga0080574_TMP2164 [Salipiger abyssi]